METNNNQPENKNNCKCNSELGKNKESCSICEPALYSALEKSFTQTLDQYESNTMSSKNESVLKNLLNQLYDECAHGDDEHRKWLKNKFESFYENHDSEAFEVEFVDKLIEQLPNHGIDTSKWEYDHGDCCSDSIEFVARFINSFSQKNQSLLDGVKALIEKLQTQNMCSVAGDELLNDFLTKHTNQK